MFDGYLAIRRLEEDVARRMNDLRLAYRELESIDPTNTLLSVVSIKEDHTKPIPFPEICPVPFSYSLRHEFIGRYQDLLYGETKNVFMPNCEAIERYVADMREEIRRLRPD